MTPSAIKSYFFSLLHFDYKIDAAYAADVINVVYTSMSGETRSYHNINHLNNMINRGFEIFGDLNTEEVLAILFHDVVYNPMDTSSNEVNSEKFMDSLLSYYYVGNHRLHNDAVSAGIIIRDTARHTKVYVEDVSVGVLDLDLIDFRDWKKCLKNSEKIKDEYYSVNWISENEYKNKRNEFLKTLISKGFIYRTEICKNKFEDKAMKNIERLINE